MNDSDKAQRNICPFKCGDIVRNNWVGKESSVRYFIFIINNGKYANVVRCNGEKLTTAQYYMNDFYRMETTREGKPAYEKVGHIDLIGFLKNPLLELLKGGEGK